MEENNNKEWRGEGGNETEKGKDESGSWDVDHQDELASDSH